MKKFFSNNFFWGDIYWFTNYFEILIFAFSNIISVWVSACKILPFSELLVWPCYLWSVIFCNLYKSWKFLGLSYLTYYNSSANSGMGHVQASKILHHLCFSYILVKKLWDYVSKTNLDFVRVIVAVSKLFHLFVLNCCYSTFSCLEPYVSVYQVSIWKRHVSVLCQSLY